MEPAELILTDAETRERDVFVERMLASTSARRPHIEMAI
jgi:hypothetical protein